MKYCPRCGSANEDDANFCAECGANFLNPAAGAQPSSSINRENNSSLIDSLNEYVGNEKPINLNWKVLFTDVFKSHTSEEAEEIFICGTPSTTPSKSSISDNFPLPWLYSRVFIMFLVTFILLWICCTVFLNSNAVPGLIMIGSFTVPLSTMILFLEVNVWKNVSVYKVIQTFFIGGCASLVATLFLFSLVDVSDLDFTGAFITGLVEELGKAIIVYMFLRRLGKLSILSGLLIGSSVGAGFAAFESAGYALRFLSEGGWDTMMNVIILRGFLAPGGHVTWAAISGAAFVIAAKSKGKISTSLFTNNKFLRLFFISVILHFIWDSPLSQIGADINLVPISLTIFVWAVILILINMGLSEINKEQ